MADTTSRPRKPRTRPSGPKTDQGKSRSSLNAVKHGATSPRLLNAQEVANYTSFIKELSNYYKCANPLVKMQIERISRLKVLIERVQEQMDSLHRIVTSTTSTFDLATKAMALDDDQTRLAAKIMQWRNTHPYSQPETAGEKFPLYRGKLRLFFELLNYADGYANTLSSHDDFLKHVPHFCEYIVGETNDRKQSLTEYLRSHQPSDPAASGSDKPAGLSINIHLEKNTQPESNGWKQASITDASVETLKIAMEWIYSEVQTYLQDFERVVQITQVIQEVEGLAIPNPADLDRLMRYQTTLQRQLSSAMGELLALVDRENPGD